VYFCAKSEKYKNKIIIYEKDFIHIDFVALLICGFRSTERCHKRYYRSKDYQRGAAAGNRRLGWCNNRTYVEEGYSPEAI
jgi:hypothetical protein